MMSASAVFFIRQLSDCTLYLSGHVGSCLFVNCRSEGHEAEHITRSVQSYPSQHTHLSVCSTLAFYNTTLDSTGLASKLKQNLPAYSMRHS